MIWSVGDELNDVNRTIGPVDMVAYAGATWDWHRLHHDHGYAVSIGLDRPVVDGQALAAYLSSQAIDSLGPGAFIRKMEIRYRSPVFSGETIRCVGRVVAIEPQRIDLEQQVLVADRVAATSRSVVSFQV